jgi:stage III sporulation protein AG
MKKIPAVYEKYKYVLLIVAVGIIFMLLPSGNEDHSASAVETAPVSERSVTEELCQILSQIRGVGKVKVMITEMTGPETLYQVDTDRTEDSDGLQVRTETVIISGNGEEKGLIQTVTPPTYLGAIVVCQGADNATVRLAVTTAVSNVTGISMDRISVLKMK